MTNEEKIQLIGQKIFLLSQNIEKYKYELDQLRQQLNQLKMEMGSNIPTEHKNIQVIEPVKQTGNPPITPPAQQTVIPPQQQAFVSSQQQQQHYQAQPQQKNPKQKSGLEEYIGGKLINIIGIILLVIGVSIGVKYAIDNDLISETGRIVLGYAAGGIILALSFLTRKKYKLFSAIIMSGSIAIMYFTSYAGFAFYHLYEAPFAFAVMVLLTAFTVFAAHVYDYEVLAVIALVGAYAIPPLLHDDKGNVHIMFTYMAILNAGVLVVSFLKNWNWVTYTAYILTWLIFGGWMLTSYTQERYFGTCFLFANIFFLMFYTMFIAYKTIRGEVFSVFDVLRILSNSSLYFGIGYFLLNTDANQDYLGLFCLANALVHLMVAGICYKQKSADRKVMFLILTLVFTFITIAVPVQLEGNWVTMIWFTEMTLLWLMAGRFNIPLYRHMAFALGILGTGSLLIDWTKFYYLRLDEFKPLESQMFLNKYFLTGLFAILTLALVRFFCNKERKNEELIKQQAYISTYSTFFAALLGAFAYLTVINEIHLNFQNLFDASAQQAGDDGYTYNTYDNSYQRYKVLWMLIYTSVYILALNRLNQFWFKIKSLQLVSWILSLMNMLVLISMGLITCMGLKNMYYYNIEQNTEATAMMHYARYLIIPFILLLITEFQFFHKQETLKWSKPVNMWITHFIIIALLSSELTFHITERNYGEYDKMLKVSIRSGYSILWAVYSLVLIVWGFSKKVKMIRFIGLTLFGITVIKLAVQAFTMSRGYQLITLSVIGILLIGTGFLYQKFKHILLEKDRDEEKDQLPAEEQKQQIQP